MLFVPWCHGSCCMWRSLKRDFYNIFISSDSGMFGSCIVSLSAQLFPHCHQWPVEKSKISNCKKHFLSVLNMESETDDSHHKSSPQREFVETPNKLSSSQNIQEKATKNVRKIHLPPSLQCKGISEKDIVNIKNPMILQEPDKQSIEDKSIVRQLPPSLQYKCRLENDLGIKKSPVPRQGQTDICDSKHHSSHSLNSQGSPERECKDSSKQQKWHGLQQNLTDKTNMQLPPSLLNFVERFVRDNIKAVTDQIKKDSHEETMDEDFCERSPFNEFEETPFSCVDLFSSSESAEGSVNVKKKKSRKWSQKFSKKKVTKSRKERGSLSLQSESDGTPDGKGTKKRPNYFIAIQVNNPEITRAVMKIQSGIQEASGQDLSHLKIAPETLHITLMVMHLSSREEIDRASQCLAMCVPAIKKINKDLPMTLEFEGLSGFSGGRVIFARIKDPGEEILHVMSDEVKKLMKDCGIEDTDPENKPFRPHLTLMKYRWKSKSKGPKKVEDSWYKDFASDFLGSQRINSLQLCEMEEKRDDGYYFVDKEVPF